MTRPSRGCESASRRALVRKATMSSESQERAIEPRLAVAAGLVKQEAFEQAVPLLEELVRDAPESELTLGLLAAACAQTGRHDRAIEGFREVLGINPDNALARFQLGLTQLLLGELEEALATWAPMLELEGEFMARFHSALALEELGSAGAARPLLERAAEHMPEWHPLHPELKRRLAEGART